MVGLSRKRVFPKTKGDSITGQDRAQKHCDFRFSQIGKKILSRSSATMIDLADSRGEFNNARARRALVDWYLSLFVICKA